MNDLLTEFAPMASRAAQCANWLAGQGIGRDIVCRPGASVVGVCRALIEGDRWQPDPDGVPAIIVPVSYSYGPCELDPIDLVAWQPGSPERWYLRTGYGTVLGEVDIDRAMNFEEPLVLYQSPLDCLKANREVCVLDWSSSLSLYFGNVQWVIADRMEVARKLKRKLDGERCWPMPDIRARSMADAA